MPSVPAASTTAAPTPQRLCPHCASVAVTAAPRCPWCGRGYRRRLGGTVAALLAVQAVVILGVLALAFAIAADTVQTRVDDSVDRVQRDIDRQVSDIDVKLREQLRQELDRRLPAVTP